MQLICLQESKGTLFAIVEDKTFKPAMGVLKSPLRCVLGHLKGWGCAQEAGKGGGGPGGGAWVRGGSVQRARGQANSFLHSPEPQEKGVGVELPGLQVRTPASAAPLPSCVTLGTSLNYSGFGSWSRRWGAGH